MYTYSESACSEAIGGYGSKRCWRGNIFDRRGRRHAFVMSKTIGEVGRRRSPLNPPCTKASLEAEVSARVCSAPMDIVIMPSTNFELERKGNFAENI
jgi:hypothetical protein